MNLDNCISSFDETLLLMNINAKEVQIFNSLTLHTKKPNHT